MAERSRCRRCGTHIDPFHWRVELGSALIGAVALAWLPGTAGWLWAFFGWLLLPLALLDARHFWLPDRLNLLLGIIGLVIAGPLLDTALITPSPARVTVIVPVSAPFVRVSVVLSMVRLPAALEIAQVADLAAVVPSPHR